MRYDIMEQRPKIEQGITEKRPKSFICQELKCKSSTLNSWLERMGIEYLGNRNSSTGKSSPNRLSALEYIATALPYAHKARIKLIEDGIKEAKCERCYGVEGMDQPIPLALHHKDGNRGNWVLENLEILCSNCHTLTDGGAGRGQGKYVDSRLKYGSRSTYFKIVREKYETEQKKKIPMLLNSDIDFSKFGGVEKAAEIMGAKPQKVNMGMKRFLPEFYEQECYKRHVCI